MAVRMRFCAALSALWMAAAAWAGAAEAVQLLPHRAVYDLALRKAEGRSGVSGASGRMVVELTGSDCEGWSISFRIVNQFALNAGRVRLVDSRSSSWEAGDGASMRYAQRQYVDNRLESEVLVSAERGSESQDGKAKATKPKAESFSLPKKAVFPVAHQKHLIEAAQAGQSRDQTTVFDGSEGAKSYLAITFIGARQQAQNPPDKVSGNGVKVLTEAPYWPVSLSYYAAAATGGEETPTHQLSFRMYDNGIATDLVLDYGDFSLDGRLASLDLIEKSACP